MFFSDCGSGGGVASNLSQLWFLSIIPGFRIKQISRMRLGLAVLAAAAVLAWSPGELLPFIIREMARFYICWWYRVS